MPAGQRTFKRGEEAGDGSGAFLVPDGDYKVKLVDSKDATSGAGNPMVVAEFEVIDGPEGTDQHFGTKFKDYFTYTDNSYWKSRLFRDAITGTVSPEGQESVIMIPWPQLNGKIVGVTFKAESRTFTRTKGPKSGTPTTVTQSKVEAYIDPRKWADTPTDTEGV
jgi:hypothetical protein